MNLDRVRLILAVFLLNAGAFGLVFAAGDSKTFEIDGMGGMAFADVSNFVGVQTGFGGGVEGYYLFGPQLGIGGSIAYHTFSYKFNTNGTATSSGYTGYNNYITLGFLDALASLKFRLGGNRIDPYLLGGVGISNYIVSTKVTQVTSTNNPYPNPPTTVETQISNGTVSSIYPEIAGGLGFEFPLNQSFGLFFQGKYCFIIQGNTTTFYIPVEGGLDISF